MSSQVALHKDLPDCFEFYNLEGSDLETFAQQRREEMIRHFEDGRVLIFDGFPVENLEYFLDHPGRWYPEDIPNIQGRDIYSAPFDSNHPLLQVCNSIDDVHQFMFQVPGFEKSWRSLLNSLFKGYGWKSLEFSYRFNHLALDRMHLDVPETLWEEHQFRWFINLDRRVRILTIGPTIFDLAERYWDKMGLSRFTHLPVHEFIGNLRREILDKTVFKERELPRHYLTLDPGAMWLSHSSQISHGLVYGRKTVCLEGRIQPHTLKTPTKHFNSKIRVLMEKGPMPEAMIEKIVQLEGLR